MRSEIARLINSMIEYEAGCEKRVALFLKVHGYAAAIGALEGLDESALLTLEAAAVTHDIGIRPSLEKQGSAAGKLQEAEGPPVARAMLEGLGFGPEVVSRVCYLISRHHTYDGIDGPDYQILVEADFLVNIFEGAMAADGIAKVKSNVFRTKSGIRMLDALAGAGDSAITAQGL